jgi:hypothetical protein
VLYTTDVTAAGSGLANVECVWRGRIGWKMPARLIVISTIPGVVPTVWRKLFRPIRLECGPAAASLDSVVLALPG